MIAINELKLTIGKQMIIKHKLITLDAIQCATVVAIKYSINYFVSCDNKLIVAAKKIKVKIPCK